MMSFKSAAQSSAELDQTVTFLLGDGDPARQLVSKDAVLGLKVLHHVGELFVGGQSAAAERRVDSRTALARSLDFAVFWRG